MTCGSRLALPRPPPPLAEVPGSAKASRDAGLKLLVVAKCLTAEPMAQIGSSSKWEMSATSASRSPTGTRSPYIFVLEHVAIGVDGRGDHRNAVAEGFQDGHQQPF